MEERGSRRSCLLFLIAFLEAMDLIESLEEEFRKVLMAYGKDREELSDGDIETIQKNVKRECMRNLSDQEVRLLYRSFYKNYWQSHAMPPRSRSVS